MLILGDCLEVLKTLPDNSVDSIVTDPPAGISFMGKAWDSDKGGKTQWIAWLSEVFIEAKRVLKPGGHALVWSLPRTSHWTATALEDAGYEVRDCVYHIFGSGFPKSLNIGKALDKRGGESVGWFGPWLRKWREENSITQKEIAALFPSKTGGLTGCVANWEIGLNLPTVEQFNTICDKYNLPFKNMEEAEREVIGKKSSGLSGGSGNTVGRFTDNRDGNGMVDITAPATPEAKQWEGWGTALKPAVECWWLVRKPLSDGGVDIAKAVCYNMRENGFNNEIVWRIKRVSPAKKQKTQASSIITEQPRMVEVSVKAVSEKETQNIGIEIERLSERLRENTEMTTKKSSMKEVGSPMEQTRSESLPIKEHIRKSENCSPLMPMEESAYAAENQDGNSLPSIILEEGAENTEEKLRGTTSTYSLKNKDTQKTDTDCSASTATSQWVCMDIARTVKIEVEGKEYGFEQLVDGSFVWDNNLRPYREPRPLNVAENVLKWGTGGLNIDGSRVESKPRKTGTKPTSDEATGSGNSVVGSSKNRQAEYDQEDNGRFPSHLIHDGSEEVLAGFPNTKSNSGRPFVRNVLEQDGPASMKVADGYTEGYYGDQGSAARFFYCAKPSKAERDRGCEGMEEKQKVFNGQSAESSKEVKDLERRFTTQPAANHHPTVKAQALMQYLIKLITPPKGVVLDPFMGSGSTGVAAKTLGFDFIGIEREEEYFKIAEARIKSVNTLL